MKLIIPLLFLLSSCTTVQPPIDKKTGVNNHPKISISSKKISFQSVPTLLKMSDEFTKNGWKNIGKNQIPAIGMAGIKNLFLRGFESHKGSQVFMMKYKISDNTARSANYINSMTDMSVYSKSLQLSRPAEAKIKHHSNGTRVLHHSLIGNGNGQTLLARNGIPTRYGAAYIPITFNNGKYSTLIVNFRGTISDTEGYQQYLNYIDTVRLPPNAKPLLQ